MLIFQIQKMIQVFKPGGDVTLENFKQQNPKYLYNMVYVISLLLTILLIPIPIFIFSGILYFILYLMQIPITIFESILIILAIDIIKDLLTILFNFRKVSLK